LGRTVSLPDQLADRIEIKSWSWERRSSLISDIESAYERWTWQRCADRILSLKRRMGYGERIWVLGFELMDDGRVFDPFRGIEIFDPRNSAAANIIPVEYSAVPEMFCILSTYAAAEDIPLSGEQVSLSYLDPLRRSELSAQECEALLKYVEQDFTLLRRTGIPFFGEKVARGDLAFEAWPLPRAPVSFVFWQGDDEVDSSGTLLFDRTVTHYLQNLVMEFARLTVWRLKNILDPEVRWGYHQLL